jgi:hypothetical protein
MEEPSEERNLAHMKQVSPLLSVQILVLALPSEEVESKRDKPDAQADGATPVDDRCTQEVVFRLGIAPPTHAKSEMHERPVEGFGRQNVLLVRIGYERIVRVHHRDVEMPEISEERALVESRLAYGKAVVPVRLDVPVGMHIVRVILFVTRDLHLLEAPLGEGGGGGTEVATKDLVTEAETRGESVDALHLLTASLLEVVDDLHDPVIVRVAEGRITVTGNFVVLLCHKGRNVMGVQVPGGRDVAEADDVIVLEIP